MGLTIGPRPPFPSGPGRRPNILAWAAMRCTSPDVVDQPLGANTLGNFEKTEGWKQRGNLLIERY